MKWWGQLRNKRFFLLCLTLTAISFPFPLRVNSLFTVLLFVAWLLYLSTQQWKLNLNNPFFKLFVSLYFIYVIGVLWSSNLDRAFFELEKKSFFLVYPLILGTIPKLTRTEVNNVLKYFVHSCILVSILCLIYASYRTISSGNFSEIDPVTNYATHYFFYYGLSDIFLHPVYFSAYIVFSIFIIAAYRGPRWATLSSRAKALTALLVIYLIIFLFLLSGRIMIIALFGISMLYTIYHYLTKGSLVRGMSVVIGCFAIAVLVVATIPVLRERFQQLITSSYRFENNPETNRNLAGQLDGVEMRLAKWYFTIEAGKNTWLFGTGTGDDEDTLLATYLANNFLEGYVPQYNAHNQFLQTWLALGLFGLLILILVFTLPLVLAIKERNFLYAGLILVIMAFCLTESVFSRQHGVSFYAFFNSLLCFHTLEISTRKGP